MSDVFICWHGTNKKNADLILANGFKQWTYFSAHLEDAIGYGGNYVFDIEFTKEYFKEFENKKPYWQFRNDKVIPVSQIRSLKKYNIKTLIEKKSHRSRKGLKSPVYAHKQLVLKDMTLVPE